MTERCEPDLTEATCPATALDWIRNQHKGWEDHIEIRRCLRLRCQGNHSLFMIWAYGMNTEDRPTLYLIGTDDASETHDQIGNLVRTQSTPWTLSVLTHMMCNATAAEVHAITTRTTKDL